MKTQVAIVGGGISGLSCAYELSINNNSSISLFEKRFEVGGRMNSLKVGNDVIFDHGAQYFTARSEGFNEFIERHSDYIHEWTGGKEGIKSLEQDEESENNVIKTLSSRTKRYTGYNNIGVVCKNIVKNISERSGESKSFQTFLDTNISRISLDNKDDKWRLHIEKEEENVESLINPSFDYLFLSGTPKEVQSLIEKSSLSKPPEWYERIKGIQMKPVGALMLSFKNKQKIPFDSAFVNHTPKSTWICRENTKPGKSENNNNDNWLIHFSSEFSNECWKSPNEASFSDIELFEIVQKDILEPYGIQFDEQDMEIIKSYVWMESDCGELSLDVGYLYDKQMKIGLIADWINNDRVEGGFMSGYLMAKFLKDSVFGEKKTK